MPFKFPQESNTTLATQFHGESSARIRGQYGGAKERLDRPRDADVYCGLSQVPTFLPASLIVMFVPWDVAWIAPV